MKLTICSSKSQALSFKVDSMNTVARKLTMKEDTTPFYFK